MTSRQFRILGYIEALSLLVLLFVAMPLKYLAGLPLAVSVVGMVHGVLFLVYVLAGIMVMDEAGWNYRRLAIAYIIASIPFGPFLFDRYLFPEPAQ